ncbi:cytochrome P450 [Chitinophagaceae bacterium OAS944]|nr:cytochrome P450 [Chitinophagaceae bacterium OAS944]
MTLFSGTYTASLGLNRKIIITQNPDLINYILKENHKNYNKSAIAKSASRFMGNGILFSNGNFWLKQRRMIQPAFHKEKLQELQSIMIKTIAKYLTAFPAGDRVDVYPLVHGLSFNVLLKSIFNIPLPPEIITEISEIFSDIQEFLIRDTNQPLSRLFYPLTGAKNVSLKKANRLREIIRGIIDQRKTENKENCDLLDMLLSCTDENTGEKMSEEQVIDEVLILIFAGHETTANTLSWLLYLLACNQEVLEQLIASFAGKNIGDCMSNEYLKATIHEGMRLYPAAWMTERVAVEDDQIGDFSFPAKTIIIPFFFGLHRDKNIWDDPLAFKPQRFINDPKLARSKYFFPFGAGPRMCIGNNFAMVEMCFFLYTFLKEFQIRPSGQVPAMKALITLRPDKVVLTIQKKSL